MLNAAIELCNMTRYSMQGWAPLRYGVFSTSSGDESNEKLFLNVLSGVRVIKVYLDQGMCPDEEFAEYYKIYTSKRDFSIGRIFSLIFETYMQAVDDLCDGDEGYIENLSISSFRFDEETNSVYPNTDS